MAETNRIGERADGDTGLEVEKLGHDASRDGDVGLDRSGGSDGSSTARRRLLRLNLLLLLLLIAAFVIQVSAIRGCTSRAARACQDSGGVRMIQTRGFGPFMSCTYECQDDQRLARASEGWPWSAPVLPRCGD